jgi:DNA uptake protein ComE-like DNA-binding protein
VERDLLGLKLRQNPSLKLSSAEEVRHLADLGWELDVNRASRRDWLRLPGIETDQVDLLMRLQAGGVQLSGIDDLQQLLELDASVVASWQPVLAFRWYGDPPGAELPGTPLDLNRATPRQLSELGLSAERCQRLLRERARRPFQDLAELQHRLQLPAAVVEGWIGKVCFGPGSAGPVLPPPLRR